MKKYIILLLLLTPVSSLLAQTKVDTEKWILEKLNKYNKPSTINDPILKDTRTEEYGYSFHFDQYYLVVTYTRRSELLLIRGSEKKKTCIEKVPIYDIKGASAHDGSLYISTYKKTIIRWCEGDTEDYVSSIFSIRFSDDAETDLEQRLNKAFVHLKKYYKKPNPTETF